MDSLNKLIIHPSFRDTIKEINKINMNITGRSDIKFDFSAMNFPPNGLIGFIEEMGIRNLDAKKGQEVSKKLIFSGYDESKLNYLSLEGSAFFTTHSLIVASKKEYLPAIYLTFYFYTKSKQLTQGSPMIKYSENPAEDSNRDYIKDRNYFLNEWAIDKSILFVDGPLIGGNMSSHTIDLVKDLHGREVIPIFFVKNSTSNLVTDYIPQLKNKYNSDMHWSFNQLKPGQRTNFFIYKDEYNPNFAKVFCYLKAFNLSPQRVEFHVDTYSKYGDLINDIMDLAYYLLLVNGDMKNAQLRPIYISEKYARSVLQMIDTYNLIKSSGLTATMNEIRFGG